MQLTYQQFYYALTLFIMEKINTQDVPYCVYSYILPNEALHKFITPEFIEAWNESIDFNQERKFIAQHIDWELHGKSTVELDEYLQINDVTIKEWINDNLVEIEYPYEKEFLTYLKQYGEQLCTD